jgi:hypothetical protein
MDDSTVCAAVSGGLLDGNDVSGRTMDDRRMTYIAAVREMSGKALGFCVVGAHGKTFHATLHQALAELDKRRAHD